MVLRVGRMHLSQLHTRLGKVPLPSASALLSQRKQCTMSAEDGPNSLRHFECFPSASQTSLLGFKTPSANQVLETKPNP